MNIGVWVFGVKIFVFVRLEMLVFGMNLLNVLVLCVCMMCFGMCL